MLNNEMQFDLLIVDDDPRWKDIITTSVDDIYSYDISGCYEETTQKLKDNSYKIICMDLKILRKGSSSIANGRKLLLFLRKNFPDLPIILISGFIIGNPNIYIEEYPNIKKILIKGESDDFMEHLEKSLIEIYSSIQDKKAIEGKSENNGKFD